MKTDLSMEKGLCCCLLVSLEMHSLFYPAVIFECSGTVVMRRKKSTKHRRNNCIREKVRVRVRMDGKVYV